MKNNIALKYFMTCSLFLITNISFAQTKKERKAMEDWHEHFYSGTIPQAPFDQTIHFHTLSGDITVTVEINGKTFTFIFDTGAPTVISDDLAKELNLAKGKTFQIGDGTGQTKPIDGYTIKEMKVGSVTFENTGCLVNNLDNINKIACTKIDGILGVNLMHECYWKINMRDSTINLSSNLPPLPAGVTPMTFNEDFTGSPYFQLQYGDSTMPVELDYGSNSCLTITDTSVANRKKQSHPFAVGYGTTAFTFMQGMQGREYMGIADSIKINGIVFRNKLVNLSAQRRVSDVGAAFMKNYETIIDWKQHQIYMNPLSNEIDTSISRSFGLKFVPDSGKLRVVFLWTTSQAEKDGIRIGDVITSVNGINTVDITKDKYCEIVNKMKQSNTLNLSFSSAIGDNRNIVLNKYNLVTE